MIYVDRNFRFYDGSKDLLKWPELKPPSDAFALTDSLVIEITADISRWRWHPTENRPYKIPDCDEKYWKMVDGVILEMSGAEKAAVDQAEADRIAAKEAAEAAEQARIDKKLANIAAALPTWDIYKADLNALIDAAQAADTLKKLQNVVVNLCQRYKKDTKVLYWLAKDTDD